MSESKTTHQPHCRAPQGFVCCCVDPDTVREIELTPFLGEETMTNKTTQTAKCTWQPDEDYTWHTDCGNAFVLSNLTPKENRMAFCCYCGKPLEEKGDEVRS